MTGGLSLFRKNVVECASNVMQFPLMGAVLEPTTPYFERYCLSLFKLRLSAGNVVQYICKEKKTPQQEHGMGTHALPIKHELVYTYMNWYMGIKDKIL
jgi:hypothetical protein